MRAKGDAQPGEHRKLHLPLQTGTTALWSLAWGVPLVASGLVAIAVVIAKTGLETGGLIAYFLVAACAPAMAGFYGLVIARAARPSDLVLDTDGVRVVGGPDEGVAVAWVELDPDRCAVTPKGRMPTLVARSRVGDEIILGRAYARSETASLQSLAATIAALARAATDAPAPPSAEDVLRTFTCPGCGAVVVATDAAVATCAYCGAGVPMPEDVRARIRAAAQLGTAARTISADATALLSSGTHLVKARTVLFVVAVVVAMIWAVALAAAAAGYALQWIGSASAALLLAASALASASVCALASGAFVDRLAVRLVSLDLAARAPRRAGEPHGCRACGCQLPEPPGAVVVACTACGATNVLGLDCRRESAVAEEQAQGLEEALRARRATRSRWLLLGVGGAITSAAATVVAIAVALWPR